MWLESADILVPSTSLQLDDALCQYVDELPGDGLTLVG